MDGPNSSLDASRHLADLHLSRCQAVTAQPWHILNHPESPALRSAKGLRFRALLLKLHSLPP
jgi:hypothetical protein